MAMRATVATVLLSGIAMAGCGSPAESGPSPAASKGGTFVMCSAVGSGSPGYAIQDSPRADCKPLVAGRDYADGRVIIGLKPGTTDAQLGPALAAYQASVISSQPPVGDRILAVPKGSVPEAVVGLGRYSFITFAAPDMIAHIDMNT
jgi:hypothetical protein